MTATIIFVVVIVLIFVLWFLFRGRLLNSAGKAGAQLGRGAVSGPSAKHRAMLARTLDLQGDAQTTRTVIDQVIAGNDRITRIDDTTYRFDSDFPTMTVQVGPQGAHLAISEFVYSMSFPQGGKVWSAFVDNVAQAATAHGLGVQEGSQDFVQVDSHGNHDELWFSTSRAMQDARAPGGRAPGGPAPGGQPPGGQPPGGQAPGGQAQGVPARGDHPPTAG